MNEREKDEVVLNDFVRPFFDDTLGCPLEEMSSKRPIMDTYICRSECDIIRNRLGKD